MEYFFKNIELISNIFKMSSNILLKNAQNWSFTSQF